MSILERERVDFGALKPGEETAHLVISDSLDWDDVEVHLLLLQEKLNTYIEFVETGQIYRLEQPSVAEGTELQVSLLLAHPPPAAAKPSLAEMERVLGALGLGFHRTLMSEVRKKGAGVALDGGG